MAATVEPAHRRVEVRVTSLMAELGLGRPLRAASLRTSLEQRDGALRFPLTVEVSGVAAEVDENIAVAGVHGTVTATDAQGASSTSISPAGSPSSMGRANKPPRARTCGRWQVVSREIFSAGSVTVDMEDFELGRVPEVLARPAARRRRSRRPSAGIFSSILVRVSRSSMATSSSRDSTSATRLLAREVVHDVGFSVDIDATIDPAARVGCGSSGSRSGAVASWSTRAAISYTREIRETRHYAVEIEVPEVGLPDRPRRDPERADPRPRRVRARRKVRRTPEDRR